MVFPLFKWGIELADRHTADGNAGVMHGLLRACDQRVPLGQRLAEPEQMVRTGPRQPIGVQVEVVGPQDKAVRHEMMAVLVMSAAAGFVVEQPAGDPGERDFTAVLVFQLVQAAFSATIAQCFPLLLGHLVEGFPFPEAATQTAAVDRIRHRAASMARAFALSASIWVISASRLSNFSSGLRCSTSPTESCVP